RGFREVSVEPVARGLGVTELVVETAQEEGRLRRGGVTAKTLPDPRPRAEREQVLARVTRGLGERLQVGDWVVRERGLDALALGGLDDLGELATRDERRPIVLGRAPLRLVHRLPVGRALFEQGRRELRRSRVGLRTLDAQIEARRGRLR